MPPRTLDQILEGRRSQPGQLIEVLQDIQENYGYISEEAMEFVSHGLGVPLIEVYSVASFYKAFRLNPSGKNVITMCMGTACHIRGAQKVLDEIRSYLGLNGKDTTDDRLFSLDVVRCLGTCFLAPVMLIGDKYFGKLTPASVRKVLKSYQARKDS